MKWSEHWQLILGALVVPALLHLGPTTAYADGVELEWERILGIVQPGNTVGSGTGAVTGAGQPFSTRAGSAELELDDGELEFRVRGLTFAGGNFIGTTGPFTHVRGVIVCDTDGSAGGGHSARVDTPMVPLSEAGNARFEGNVGPLPMVCTTEPDVAFLIVNPGNMWVAHGANREFDDD